VTEPSREGETTTPPQVVVIGGPNGAGKTTCAAALLPEDLRIQQFVNADTIAAGLSAFAPDTVAVQAGRIMLARIANLAEQRQNFAFETTLASRSFAPFLRRIQREGYLVHIVYVWLRSPELAIERVQDRVRRGGHHVPEATVRRRYWRGLTNFKQVYQPIADSWVLCNNSGGRPMVVAQGKRQVVTTVEDAKIYDEFQRSGPRE
jgi:predicted ABC-type ATPase